jgi:hypothetical protein
MSAVEIHHELCVIYDQTVMNEGTVRQWRRTFKDGRTNVHDEEQSGRPSVVSDDPVQSVDKKICERWRFTISYLSHEFPQISSRPGYHKFCARWVLKMLTSVYKMQRITLALYTFLERYHKDCDDFLITSYE